MALTRARPTDQHPTATVSQATRADAKPPTIQFASFTEEWTDLVQRRMAVQRELQELSRRASADNMAIRAKYKDASEGICEWMRIKGVIEKEQLRLREELHAIEDRTAVIKPKKRLEEQRLHERTQREFAADKHNRLDDVLKELAEVKAIVKAIQIKLENKS